MFRNRPILEKGQGQGKGVSKVVKMVIIYVELVGRLMEQGLSIEVN